MDLQSLIGQQFDEMYLFELLLFDIEQDREQFRGRFLHLFFDQLPNQQILITELHEYSSRDEYSDAAKSLFTRQAIIEIEYGGTEVELCLIRLDGHCEGAWVLADRTRRQSGKLCYLESDPNLEPMTIDEMRIGFAELLGIFEEHQERELSRRRKRSA